MIDNLDVILAIIALLPGFYQEKRNRTVFGWIYLQIKIQRDCHESVTCVWPLSPTHITPD
jgi:hypothetical protein